VKYSEKSSSRHLTTSIASPWLNEASGILLEALDAFLWVSSSTRGRLSGLSISYEVLCGSVMFDKVWIADLGFLMAS